MIRGCQKKIMFLKDTGCDYFESAYFVINPGYDKENDSDIIKEANRILNEAGNKVHSKKSKSKSNIKIGIVGLLCGLFSGAGISLLTLLLI